MGGILNNHNGIKLNPQLQDIGYLTSSGKKAVGVLGEVMLVNTTGEEVDMTNINATINELNPAFYIGKSATMTGGDFEVAYTAATQLTLSAYPGTITAFTADDIELVRHFNASGDLVAIYHRDDARMTLVADVLTVTGATFGATDTFIVATNVVATGGYDSSLDLIKVQEQYPLSEQYLETSIADTTNVANATYYPSATGMAFGAYKNLSITGKLIDGAAETTTLTVEVTNDSDTTTGDWVQIYGYDTKNNSIVNSIAATNQTTTYALDFDNFNYANVRFKITTTAATNTVIIKLRRSY